MDKFQIAGLIVCGIMFLVMAYVAVDVFRDWLEMRRRIKDIRRTGMLMMGAILSKKEPEDEQAQP